MFHLQKKADQWPGLLPYQAYETRKWSHQTLKAVIKCAIKMTTKQIRLRVNVYHTENHGSLGAQTKSLPPTKNALQVLRICELNWFFVSHYPIALDHHQYRTTVLYSLKA